MKFIRPRRLPEANIQAELYRQLRNRDIKCCLEYRIYVKSMDSFIRADVIIIKDSIIICIIECKSRREGSKPNKNGRQYRSYASLGVPFMYCMTFKQVPKMVDEVIKITNNLQRSDVLNNT